MTHAARLALAVPALAGALLLAACGGSASTGTSTTTAAGGAATSSASAAGASASTSAATSPATSAATSPATSPAASPTTTAAKGVLVLEPDGLGVASESGSIRHLPFGGTDAAALKGALTVTLGTPQAGDLPECGQGPRTYLQVNGFQVLLDGTTFVGWTDQGAAGRTLTTAAGLGVGSTLGDVKAALDVTVQTDSLGPEFFTSDGSFGGILDGTKDSSKVTVLYAGETCFFR